MTIAAIILNHWMSPANINPMETRLKLQDESSHLLILSWKLVKCNPSVIFLETEQYKIWQRACEVHHEQYSIQATDLGS